jgi:hypothetical protein
VTGADALIVGYAVCLSGHAGLDVDAETITVAIAEPDGEVRSIGTIPNRNRFRFANPAAVTPIPAPLLRHLSGHGKRWAKLGGLRQPIPPRWPRAFPPSLEHKIPRMCSMARSSGSAITHAQAPLFPEHATSGRQKN